MPVKTAEAVWNGTLIEGNGHLKTQSGEVDADYNWKSRAESGPQTNPEELIGAAHAGCFSMAFAHMLTGAGFPPTQINTKAAVKFEKLEGGFGIVGIDLTTEAKVPNIDAAKFQELAGKAKEGCPVSKALAAVKITLSAKLV